MTTAQETTERKRTDEAYKTIVRTAMDGFWLADTQGRILDVNDAYCHLLGYSREELLNMRIQDIEAVESPEETAQHIRRITEVGEDRFETRHRCKDGRVIDVEVSVNCMDIEGGQLFVFLRDITERKQMIQAVQESEKRYRLLAENVSDVIWVTDMKLQPTYISPSMENLLGYTAEESMKRRPMDALAPASLRVASEAFASAMTAGREEQDKVLSSRPLDLEFIRKDGSSIWACTKVSFLRDQHGHPIAIMGVLRDITERRDAKKRLEQSLEKLQRTMEGTIQAVTAIAEWRDPFTAGHQKRVAQLACAIAREMDFPPEQIEVVHMAGLLHDIGKISVPHEILSKPGRLSDAEMGLIRIHSQVAYDILKTVDFPWPIADMVVQHHERIDGSGYPAGLHEDEILMEARILAVADVVEAMTAHRPYRKAPGLDKALEEISQNSGRLYDTDVVYACLRLFNERGFTFEDHSGQFLTPTY